MKLAIGPTVSSDLEGNVRVVFVIDLSFVAGGYHAEIDSDNVRIGKVQTRRIGERTTHQVAVSLQVGSVLRSAGGNNHIRYAQKELLVQCQEYNSPVPLRHQVSIGGKV